MEIKKTENGWEYGGIVFVDQKSAKAAKKKEESSDKGKQIDTSQEAVLVYDSERPTSFGRFVQMETRERQWSINQFAELVGVSKQSFHAWIRGDSLPFKKHTDRLVELTGISRKDLLAALKTNLERHALNVTGATEEEYSEIIKASGSSHNSMET